MKYFISGWQNLTNFSGRATRKEYWLFILISYGIINILGIVGALLTNTPYAALGQFILMSSISYALVAFIPTVAVLVRRLHDFDAPAWLAFILIIPYFGQVLLFFSGFMPSKPGVNKFGPNPHGNHTEQELEAYKESLNKPKKVVTKSQQSKNADEIIRYYKLYEGAAISKKELEENIADLYR